MNSEHEMKAALDGWFFTIDYERNTTVSKAVHRSYIPDHKPRWSELFDDVVRVNGNTHQWDDEQDATILARAADGASFGTIGNELGLSQTTVVRRYRTLCRQQGMKPRPRSAGRPRKHSEGTEAAVVAHRKDGKTFGDIANLLGLSKAQVYEIYRTYRVRCDKYRSLERQAA